AARRTRRRAKRAVVAGAIVGVLVLVLVVALVVNTAGGGKVGGGGHEGAAPGGGAAPAAVAGGDRPVATLSATTVQWQEAYGTRLPTGEAGPHRVANGLASGFDHTPDGAVLAGIHILTRAGMSFGPKVFEPTINNQVIGADKDALLANVEAEYQQKSGSGPVGRNGEVTGDFVRAKQENSGVWGYRLDSYAGDTAFVQVLLVTTPVGAQRPTYVNIGQNLHWVQGDWRLSAPLRGDWSNVSRMLPNPPQDYVSLGRS
ncbi:MAG: hypothetical protein LC808_08545, partial [Actinobacteria bacterium]|nr:hypothetical protein [Actinomycetota bacterium]